MICKADADEKTHIQADEFLIKQALFNLMDNALDFVHANGEIEWSVTGGETQGPRVISIFNTGPHIPDYAMARLTERFYSLPRENGNKSTGLELNFVEQVVKIHDFELLIENVENGVKVSIIIP